MEISKPTFFHFFLFSCQQTVSSTELTRMLFVDEKFLCCKYKFIQLFASPTMATNKLNVVIMIKHQSNHFISCFTFYDIANDVQYTDVIFNDSFLCIYIHCGLMNFSISYNHRRRHCSKTLRRHDHWSLSCASWVLFVDETHTV